MSNEEGKSGSIWLKVGIGILILLIVGIVAMFFFLGPDSALTVIKVIFGILIAVGILAGLIAIILWLLSKKRIDILSVRNDSIIKACKESKNPLKQELWFMGDSFLSTRKIGDIVGFAMESCAPEHKVVTVDVKNNKKALKSQPRTIEPIIHIAFKNTLFGKPKIFVGTQEDIHGGFKSLSASKVLLAGTTFAAMLYDQYFLSRHWNNPTLIDKTVAEDCQRYTLQENLRDMKTHIDAAIDIDAQHAKQKELTNIDSIPLGGGSR